MAERFDDFERDRERGRDAGQRFEDYRRQWRGEPEGSRERSGYGAEISEFGQSYRENWPSRERGAYTGRGFGGGMGDYFGEDWKARRQGSYGGGLSEGYGVGPGYWQGAYSGYAGAGTYAGPETTRGFAGRGPKTYTRTDARIREDVCELLTQHPDIDASDVEVRVSNGEITLTGTVHDRDQKRMAEDIAEDLTGVRYVHNQLRVSKGIGQRIGEALGLTHRTEDDRVPSQR